MKKKEERTIREKDIKDPEAKAKEVYKSAKEVLEEMKRRILDEISERLKGKENLNINEIGDLYDITSLDRDKDLMHIIGEREREKLLRIEEALLRIKEGTYGICEECGNPIGEGRLRAMPFATLCVDCKNRKEKEEHFQKRIEIEDLRRKGIYPEIDET